MALHTEPGIRTYQEALSDEACQSILQNALVSLPDKPEFDDDGGVKGYVLWRRRVDGQPPVWTTNVIERLEGVTFNPTLQARFCAIQLNEQLPGGEQAFHTDGAIDHTIALHLGPNGLFEYIGPDGQVTGIGTYTGDAVEMTKAREIKHRGRNIGPSTRYTLALFFSSKRHL